MRLTLKDEFTPSSPRILHAAEIHMVARVTTALAVLTIIAFGASANAARAPRYEEGPIQSTVKTKLMKSDKTNASGSTMTPASQTSSAPQLRVAALAPAAQTLGPNLIQNPGFETAGTNGLPANWAKGGYGTNTRVLSYPVAGNASAKAAKIAITSYTSGDAKWYFPDIAITGGATYQFSDYSMSDVSTIIDVVYTMKDGSVAYADVATVAPSPTYKQTIAQFTAPANAKSLTIYHVIKSVGTLSVDDYSLKQVTDSPAPQNLVPNGDLESGTTAPTSWRTSRLGTNSAVFTYPVAGVDGGRAIRTTVSGYSSGDAKWYFTPIALSSGVYTYSDQYSSSAPSTVTVQLQNADGTFSYIDIASPGASGAWKTVSADFTVPNGTQNVTVFHLLQQNGTLSVDNVSIVKKSELTGIFSTGAVTLRFDDAWASQYQNALPKMQSAGIKGTFYVVTQQLSNNGFPAYMSKAQVQDLYAKGMEIGAHTRTHPDLTTLTAAQAQTEIQGSRTDLLGWNVGSVSSFAYPFGAYTAANITAVKNAGFTSAAATINGDVTPTSDPYQLENHELQKNTSLAQAKLWIDEAASKRLWLILTIHEVGSTCGQYCVSTSTFNGIVDYLKSKSVPVVTVSQAMQSLQ